MNRFEVQEEDPFDLPDSYMDALIPALSVEPDVLRLPTPVHKNRELTKARQKLMRDQRTFVKAMELTNFNVKAAHKALEDSGLSIKIDTCYRWNRSPRVQKVFELMTEQILERAGISRRQILLDTAKVRDAGMTPRRRYVQGTATGEMEIEGGVALKALELLGKNKKLWSEEVSTRVAVQVELIDWSGPRTEVIEGKILDEPEPTSPRQVSSDGEDTRELREVD